MPYHARWDPSKSENVQPNKSYIAKLSCVDKHESNAWIKLTDIFYFFLISFNFLKKHNIVKADSVSGLRQRNTKPNLT